MSSTSPERLPLLPKSSHSPLDLPLSAKALILLSTWTCVFLGALDTTIVATLVGPISSSFSAANQASWLGTSFLATLAGCTPAYGRISDIYGRRPVILFAITLFTIGTLGCGLSRTFLQLVVCRALAGCGGGGLMVLSSIIASDLMPLRKRGLIQGFANLFYGSGSALGGPLGGIVCQYYGWRIAFLAQVPVLCISAVLVATFVHYDLPQSSEKKASLSRVDWAGSLTILLSVSGLLVSLSYKTNEGMPLSDWRVWAPALFSLAFIGLFFLAESRFTAEPILPMRLLTQRSPACTLTLNFFSSAAGFSVLYYYPLFQQVVLKQSSAEAGVRLIPNSIAASIGSLGAGYIMRHTGRFWLLTVLAVSLPSLGLLPLTRINVHSSEWLKWVSVTPVGMGMGAATTCGLIALIAHVNREDVAVSTASSYLFRYGGQVVGVASSGAVLQWNLDRELHRRITGDGAEELIQKIRRSSEVVATLPPALRPQAEQAYETALHAVFWANLLVVFMGTMASLLITERPLPGSKEEEEESEGSNRQ